MGIDRTVFCPCAEIRKIGNDMFVKFGAITCHRMITAKEMSPRSNAGNGIKADIIGLAFITAAEIGDR